MDQRIVVTGFGAISALGNNREAFAHNLFAGFDGVDEISRFDPESVQCRRAAEVRGFVPAEHINEKDLSFYDPFSQFAVVAAREAVAHAGITIDAELTERCVVLFGTGVGGQQTQEDGYRRLFIEGAKRLHPFTVPKLIPSSAASLISMDLGVTGPTLGITSACSSSGHAIAQGMLMLRSGMADVVIAGGAEAPVVYGCVKAWESMRVLAKDCCRPFSTNRGGTILGEGAAALILETLDHAQARGADIHAEIVGFGMSSDAHHIVQPTVDGPARAMSNAVQSAGIDIQQIDYLNAHGSGTGQNDPIETKAIRKVFGEHADRLGVSSTKSMHGHTLGAASALEAVATILALRKQRMPPTINYLGADPDCDLDYVTNEARDKPMRYAMSNSFAFGGLNVSLVLGPVHDADV